MKRAFVLCCILIMSGFMLIPPNVNPFLQTAYAAPPVSTHAEAAALIDVDSGRILYSYNGNKEMRIASLTKVMTAIVAITHAKLTDQVTVGRNAYRKEGSSIYLHMGEKMSLNDMLYGLMLRSGNDAATAIAEHVGGSIGGFAYMINSTARMLGMTHSHFVNPHGLDAPNHYSSAIDMAKLTAYALHNPIFKNIVKTKRIKVPNPNEAWDYTWRNKNKMLSMYDGADGVKTGYTKKAGRCLISSATRNGQQLAVVTLNDPADWVDHQRLLDYGFKYFPQQNIVSQGSSIQGYDLYCGESFNYPLADGEQSEIKKKLVIYKKNSLNYRLGSGGKLEVELGSKVIGTVPLYPRDSPLLQQNRQRSAFQYVTTRSDSAAASQQSLLLILQQVVKDVFTCKL